MIGFDVLVSGQALNDLGFEAYDHAEGIGLVTFGFVWPDFGIWAPTPAPASPINTSWHPYTDLTVATIWTPYYNH